MLASIIIIPFYEIRNLVHKEVKQPTQSHKHQKQLIHILTSML